MEGLVKHNFLGQPSNLNLGVCLLAPSLHQFIELDIEGEYFWDKGKLLKLCLLLLPGDFN